MPADAATVSAMSPSEIYDRFQDLRRERKLRHRDAAQLLGVSEGEAIASAVGRRAGLGAVRLTGPWPAMFEQMPALGTVLALTRNESAVHEKVGRYEDLSHEGLIGLALGKAIDLRIFYHRWRYAYAVTEESPKGEQRSLQIYDVLGDAVHKVFLREGSDLAAWMDFVERNAHDEQAPGEAIDHQRLVPEPTADEAVDVVAFRAAWAAMQDTHEFFPLLRKFGLVRTQALRLAAPDMVWRIDLGATRALLQDAAGSALSIMCFVGNPGMIQIHTGPVRRIEVMGPWLNVLDADFNLHLREDRIAQSWVVRKPTVDGIVTSVELFDADGETIAMFFGERKPGTPELPGWRELVARLPRSAA
jgi:putative hemin transport protein